VVLRTEPRAFHVLGKCCITEQPQPVVLLSLGSFGLRPDHIWKGATL
jgi:hypothetical protein